MINRKHYFYKFRKYLAIAACSAVAACGGGGGGGNGSTGATGGTGTAGAGSQPGTTAPSLTVSSDKSSLNFISIDSKWAASETVRLSLSNAPANTSYFAKIEGDSQASFDAQISESSLTSLSVRINASNIARDINGSIVFKLCSDANCASVAWTRTLPYQARAYTVDTSEISITAAQGGTASAARPLGHLEAAADLTATVDGASWLSAQIDSSGQLLVNVSGVGMQRGRYNSSVQLGLKSSPGITVRVPVIADIGAGASLPENRSIDFDANSPAVINSSVALAFQGGQSPAWTATSDKEWLVTDSRSGVGSGNVAFHIDGNKLASLSNFSSDTAKLTIKPAGQDEIVHSIAITKKLPEVSSVNPALLAPSQAATVSLRGRGFQQLGNVTRVKVNGTAMTSGTIVSDSEIALNLPPLASGSHAIGFTTSSGLSVTQPSISVANPQPLPQATFDTDGDRKSIAFSSLRNAFYVVNSSTGVLERYRVTNGTWSRDKSIPIGKDTRIGLTIDQQILYATSGPIRLEARDPETLEVTETYTCTPCLTMSGNYISYGAGLSITNDGRVWFAVDQWSDLLYFDPRTKTFVSINPNTPSNSYYPGYAISADGSRMLVTMMTDSLFDFIASFRYDPATATITKQENAPRFGSAKAALSGDGKYVLVGGADFYELPEYRKIGSMPTGTGDIVSHPVISHDGSRIYSIPPDQWPDSIKTLDVIRTSDMSKIGEIQFPDGLSECFNFAPNCPYGRTFVITPMNDAIIWSGNKKIAVVPIPAALKPESSAKRFSLIKVSR